MSDELTKQATHPWRSIRFNATKLIADLGGPARVMRLLDNYARRPVMRKTVEKWAERDSIPSNSLFLIIVAAAMAGQPISILDYLEIVPPLEDVE